MRNRRQLAQVRPENTEPLKFIQLQETAHPFDVDIINVCNVTNNPIRFSIYHDASGEVFDEGTALVFEERLAARRHYTLELKLAGWTVLESMAVQTDTPLSTTFTAYGTIIGELL